MLRSIHTTRRKNITATDVVEIDGTIEETTEEAAMIAINTRRRRVVARMIDTDRTIAMKVPLLVKKVLASSNTSRSQLPREKSLSLRKLLRSATKTWVKLCSRTSLSISTRVRTASRLSILRRWRPLKTAKRSPRPKKD